MSSTATTFLAIPKKPDAPIAYTLFPSTSASPQKVVDIIVFINGLGLPASAWQPSITKLQTTLPSCPSILTYDRFAQGLTTSKDPADSEPGKESGHSFLDVVYDLQAIIEEIAKTELGVEAIDLAPGKFNILLVGASIGVPIVRLYAQHFPALLVGAIFLDSNICNANYSEILPDPDSPSFDPTGLLDEDCNLEQYRTAWTALKNMFDLGVKNPENLDRSTGKALLPLSDGPTLVGASGGLWLSVVGHDPETFVRMGMERMGTPRTVSQAVNR